MTLTFQRIESVPTNVITGFLGVGKSTAILNLLAQKPSNERWAVLVNEFGEVGVDGSLIAGKGNEESGVFIREVPGGCMCCTAGLPMQIALNMLLARAKPDRLLIEPTGLGHPQEVLATLSSEHYREVLDLRASITLVDARKIRDERYTSHKVFNEQLAIADVIVANKADAYQHDDFAHLLSYLEGAVALNAKPVYQVSYGRLPLEWLEAAALTSARGDEHGHHLLRQQAPGVTESALATPEIPDTGYLSVDNAGEGFCSRGWIFDSAWIFDASKLYSLLMGVDAERIKGVFITDSGIIGYNKADNVLTEIELDESLDSRIECIASDEASFEDLEALLLACVISK